MSQVSQYLVFEIRRKWQTHPSHSVDGRLSKLMAQVISLDEANAVFSGDSPLHLYSALDHAVDNIFCRLPLGFVEEDDC